MERDTKRKKPALGPALDWHRLRDWRHTQEVCRIETRRSLRAMGPQLSYFFLVVFLAVVFLAGAFFAGAFLVAIASPFSGTAGVWSHTLCTKYQQGLQSTFCVRQDDIHNF